MDTTHQQSSTETDSRDNLSSPAAAWSESTRHFVQQNPVASTVISFAAGFAAGVGIAVAMGGTDSTRRENFASQITQQVHGGLSSLIPHSLRS